MDDWGLHFCNMDKMVMEIILIDNTKLEVNFPEFILECLSEKEKVIISLIIENIYATMSRPFFEDTIIEEVIIN